MIFLFFPEGNKNKRLTIAYLCKEFYFETNPECCHSITQSQSCCLLLVLCLTTFVGVREVKLLDLYFLMMITIQFMTSSYSLNVHTNDAICKG